MINNYVEDKPKRKEEFLYPGPSKGGAAPAPAPASPAPGSPPPPGMEFKKLINNVDLVRAPTPYACFVLVWWGDRVRSLIRG